jgi:methionyl aminopeptidase
MNNNIFIYKTEEEKDYFRKAGKLAANVLEKVCKAVKPGISTLDLDVLAETWIKDHGAIPTFKGYLGFPSTLCTSVNHEVVHGIPNNKKILQAGDIISIDVGVTLMGLVNGQEFKFVGDNARTVPVGEIPEKTAELLAYTKAGLEAGIEASLKGNKISDIAKAIEKVAKSKGYGLVRDFGGHGIGPEYHSAPFIPNYTDYFTLYGDSEIKEGMILAIEPMFNLGVSDIRKLKDNWTIVTKDNKNSAHFEHSILITDGKPEILTMPD